MLTGDELLAKVKELRPPEEKKEPTITKEQLDQLWNALEYTRATISGGRMLWENLIVSQSIRVGHINLMNI
jgi:hypothetical protein